VKSSDIYEKCLEFDEARLAAKAEWIERRATELYRLLRRTALEETAVPWQLRIGGLIVATGLRVVGKADLALQVARWAMSVDPDSWDDEDYYRFQVGSCYLTMSGKEKEAVAELARAVELLHDDPKLLPFAHQNLARAYENIREYERAVEHYTKLIELLSEPQSYEEREMAETGEIRIAECYWQMQRHDDALEAVQRVLERKHLEPGNRPLAYSVRAGVHVHRGDFSAAAEDYRNAIAIAEEDIKRRSQSPYPEQERELHILELKEMRRKLISYLRRCEETIQTQAE
jgi:tetratricopeptide (TPR) repeat protein